MPSDGRVFYFISTCDSVRVARREAEDQLAEWGCDEDVAARMVLCVSEFASNAVQHARASQSYLVLCFLADGFLTVGVLDFDDSSLPCRTEASPDRLTGRGLMIVEGVADGWGVTPFKGGKLVFARAKVAPPDLTATSGDTSLSGFGLAGVDQRTAALAERGRSAHGGVPACEPDQRVAGVGHVRDTEHPGDDQQMIPGRHALGGRALQRG
jgi:anti-sigma regulatory factor (Ser/Thr protein kinase)